MAKRYQRKIVKKTQRKKKPVVRRKLGGLSSLTSDSVNRAVRRHFAPMMATMALGGAAGYASKYSGRKAAQREMTRMITRKKSDEGTGPYAQWSQRYDSKKFGKLTQSKLIKQNIEQSVYSHTRMGRFAGNGQVYLGNYLSTAIGYVGDNFLPCLAVDLTSVPNHSSGSVVNFAPVRWLYKTTTNQTLWFPVEGTTATGAIDNNWQVEKSPNTITNPSTYPGDQSILKWVGIEMELWGCKTRPTKFVIDLCQFSDDVCPNYDGSTDGNYEEFWDSYIKQYAFNPLAMVKSGFGKNKVKVWRRQAINIDPTSTTESDTSPHCKTLKLFYRLNRKCQYDWKYKNADGVTIADLQSNKWQQEDAENQNQVHPNARLFLMIRATNFNYTTAGGYGGLTSDNNPSVSWKIRTCHIMNQ